jgi:hypothetical protein
MSQKFSSENWHLSKLTEEQVIEIKARIATNEQTVSISRGMDVTESMVYHIRCGRGWRYVQVPPGYEIPDRYQPVFREQKIKQERGQDGRWSTNERSI